jgi:hypothetical protein
MKKIIASIIGALMALTLPLAASAQSPRPVHTSVPATTCRL